MSRDVVITGIGIVSPIGVGREDFELALREKRSGVANIEQYDPSAMRVPYGAEIKDFQPKLYVKPRKSLKVMCREIQLGVASASLAVEDAALDTEQIEAERFGVVYGCPMFYSDSDELASLFRKCADEGGNFDFTNFGEQSPKEMQPLWMLKYLPNMTASHIGIAHNARGANNSVVMGDVSSLLAIIESATVIQRGLCDVMLTGGSGNRLSLTPVVYRGDSNLSQNPNPEEASRPFDLKRDGQVIGEGAATLVLEEREHAEKRGANVLGCISGFATTHTGSDLIGGMSAAIARSITCCLEQAGVESVGQVNAHGLSEKQHDISEAAAIHSKLGDVPVTAIKSYFGNVGAASSALELAASLCSKGDVPATLNLTERDPECPISVSPEVQPANGNSILKLCQTAMGQAAAVLIET